jgi:CO dehydrogenase nickel-insertion accessory protein CooC1
MCRAHATVRGLRGEIVAGASDLAVADMEAGLEHLSRGTPRDRSPEAPSVRAIASISDRLLG